MVKDQNFKQQAAFQIGQLEAWLDRSHDDKMVTWKWDGG
jgi:hypothetical protein